MTRAIKPSQRSSSRLVFTQTVRKAAAEFFKKSVHSRLRTRSVNKSRTAGEHRPTRPAIGKQGLTYHLQHILCAVMVSSCGVAPRMSSPVQLGRPGVCRCPAMLPRPKTDSSAEHLCPHVARDKAHCALPSRRNVPSRSTTPLNAASSVSRSRSRRRRLTTRLRLRRAANAK